MGTVLLVLQLIVAIFLVAIILLQRSNGGALSGLGGSTSVNGLLSARGKGNILTRITAILATLFFALSLALSIYYSRLEIHAPSIVDIPPAASNEQVPVAEENNIPSVPVAEENNIPSVPVATQDEAPAPVETSAAAEVPAEVPVQIPVETAAEVPAEAPIATEAPAPAEETASTGE